MRDEPGGCWRSLDTAEVCEVKELRGEKSRMRKLPGTADVGKLGTGAEQGFRMG